jgi:starvation-inducible outer membrane lipoprotein
MARIIILSFLLQGCTTIPLALPVVFKAADMACEADLKCKAGKYLAKKLKERDLNGN